jgi:transcriptional regulator with XRE-family HTH domain
VPHPVDLHVGARIRVRRLLLGMNQDSLAARLGLTFQQVQKYEHGTNRVSASRLAMMAESLGVPVGYFFADLDINDSALSADEKQYHERMQQPETINLVRFYTASADPRVSARFLDLVKAIAASR